MIFLKFFIFTYFIIIIGCNGSLQAARGLSLVTVQGHLTVVASLVAAHGFRISRHMGSSWTRTEPRCPALEGGFLTTGLPGKSTPKWFLIKNV